MHIDLSIRHISKLSLILGVLYISQYSLSTFYIVLEPDHRSLISTSTALSCLWTVIEGHQSKLFKTLPLIGLPLWRGMMSSLSLSIVIICLLHTISFLNLSPPTPRSTLQPTLHSRSLITLSCQKSLSIKPNTTVKTPSLQQVTQSRQSPICTYLENDIPLRGELTLLSEWGDLESRASTIHLTTTSQSPLVELFILGLRLLLLFVITLTCTYSAYPYLSASISMMLVGVVEIMITQLT